MEKYDSFSLMCAWSHHGALVITQADYSERESALSAFRAAIANDVISAGVFDEHDHTVVEYPRS